MPTTSEIQNWIQNSGYGTFSPTGGFTLNGGDNSALAILGANQAAGGNANDLSTALRGAYSPDQITAFQGAHQPQTDIYASVYNADQARAGAPIHGAGTGGTPPQMSGGGNPYLGGMADDLTRRINQQRDQALQTNRSNASLVGGLGGSRQGIAEGKIYSGASDALTGGLANMFGTDWANQQNRDLQRYGIDSNYDLGSTAQRNSFYSDQRNQDRADLQTGASLYGLGNQLGWNSLSNANSVFQPYSGLGGTTTQSQSGGGGWQGALGGALGATQLGVNAGWWGTSPTTR